MKTFAPLISLLALAGCASPVAPYRRDDSGRVAVLLNRAAAEERQDFELLVDSETQTGKLVLNNN